MDLDKDDLAILCRDLTKEEVDRVHRLLHEWGTGPEDSFPAQFSLLTRAQLRAAGGSTGVAGCCNTGESPANVALNGPRAS